MKLFGKRQLILCIIGLTVGLILAGYVMKMKSGEINYWIIGLTGLIGLLIFVFIGRYANK
jgi:hypothetical protein